MHFGHGVGTARGLLEHLGVDGGQVVGGDTGDARGFVVGHGQGDRVGAVAVVVGLDLGQRCVDRCGQSLYFGHGVSTALGLFEHLGVDGGQVVGGDTGDARGFIVGHDEGGGRGAVALVVGLDFGQGCVDRCGQGLHFGHGVGTARVLFEHLGIDGSQVV